MNSLKNHPFAIEAYFDYSIVLSYAVPKKYLASYLPHFLSLDLHQEEFAFFTIALVKVKDLRPKGFPTFMGQNFHLIGHRIFVKYQSIRGKRLRGLYILKSQTDKQQMVLFGNAMTHYKYEKISIRSLMNKGNFIMESDNFLTLKARKGNEQTTLPPNSPFQNWKESQRFAGPLPFTFSALGEQKVLIVEGVRSHWKPTPLEIESLHISLDYPFMDKAILANAFLIEQISYYWKKGRVESW